MQALQARRGQKEQQEQQEQERQDNEQQQGESGESLPRMETASPYDRLCPCAAATRPAPGGLSWERLGRIALLVNSSEILTKSLPEASRDLPELILGLLACLGVCLGLCVCACACACAYRGVVHKRSARRPLDSDSVQNKTVE